MKKFYILLRFLLLPLGSDLAVQAPNLSLVELGRQMGVVGGPEEAPFPPQRRPDDVQSGAMALLPCHAD